MSSKAAGSRSDPQGIDIAVTIENDDGSISNLTPSDLNTIVPSKGSSLMLRSAWAQIAAKLKRPDMATTPSRIQLLAWQLLLPCESGSMEKKVVNSDSSSIIGISPTGSGKTMAYCIPMLVLSMVENASGKSKANGPFGVVLAPTRELAIQIGKAITLVASCISDTSTRKKAKAIKVAPVYGGMDREDQLELLCSSTKSKTIIVTATPGRLADLINEPRVKKVMRSVRMIVLDEADRLAACKDMSEEIRDILCVVRHSDTRVCLFSATYPYSAHSRWKGWTRSPCLCIKIDTTSIASSKSQENATGDKQLSEREKRKLGCGAIELSRIPEHVTQRFHYCASESDKIPLLVETLSELRRQEKAAKARRKGLCLVFFNRIKTLQSMHAVLLKEGLACGQLHGKKDQKMRNKAMQDFKCGKVPTLLATDIATRGIHVNNLEHVINFDFPEALDQYVHRCGRTGRTRHAAKEPLKSYVCSFYTPGNHPIAADLVTMLKESNTSPIDEKLQELAQLNSSPIEESKKSRST